jgi:zinc transporter 9
MRLVSRPLAATTGKRHPARRDIHAALHIKTAQRSSSTDLPPAKLPLHASRNRITEGPQPHSGTDPVPVLTQPPSNRDTRISMASGSRRAVMAAVLGNGVLALLKLLAFIVSGSGAMLSEAIHSFADTTNQALLWLGIRLSERPADPRHPYGYGAERFFWSLVSAMGIFFLGAGITLYHGVHTLLHPEHIEIGLLTWVVLALALLIEGAVLVLAVRAADHRRAGRSWPEFLRTARDPALLAVLLEDAIAVTGVFIASAGILLAHFLENPVFDAAASIVIGLLLAMMAVVLAMRNRTLLLGQSASAELESKIRAIVMHDPVVGRILHLRTRILDVDAHLVDLEVDFDPDTIVERLMPDIRAAAETMRGAEDLEAFARTFARRLVDELALEVDRLEEKVRESVPTAWIIDIEGD